MPVSPLEFFMPGRVRGNDFDTKLENFRRTLQKVIDDSASDTSQYRIGYAHVHKHVLGSLDHDKILSGEVTVRQLLERILERAPREMTHTLKTRNPGAYDATGRLAVEIMDILSVESEDV